MRGSWQWDMKDKGIHSLFNIELVFDLQLLEEFLDYLVLAECLLNEWMDRWREGRREGGNNE